MKRALQTYEEWLLTAGEQNQWGQKILITYSLCVSLKKEWWESAFRITRDSFERALFTSGHKPEKITFAVEDDVASRVKDISSLIDTHQGCQLDDFASIVYEQARDFYNEIKRWEEKSLWQYLKYWVKRKSKSS